MKTALRVLALILLVNSAVWSQFYTYLTDQEKKEMAEAYYLSGMQYIKVGEESKGNEFITMAFTIDPDLDPKGITEKESPSKPSRPATPQQTIDDILAPPEGDIEVLLRSIFLRFVGALISEDVESALVLFDSSIFVESMDTSVTRDQAKRMFTTLFAEVSRLELPESKLKLYNLETMKVSRSENGVYLLEINSLFDLSQKVPFWKHHQVFSVHKQEGSWVVFSIG